MDNNFWGDLGMNILGDVISAILIGIILWLFRESFYKLFLPLRLKLVDSHNVGIEAVHEENIFHNMELNLMVLSKQEGRNYAINRIKSTCLVFDKKGDDISIVDIELIPTENTKKAFPLAFHSENRAHKLEFLVRRKDLEMLKNLRGTYYKLSFRFIEINPKDDLIEEIDISEMVRDYSKQKIFAFETALKLVDYTEDYFQKNKEAIKQKITATGLLDRDQE